MSEVGKMGKEEVVYVGDSTIKIDPYKFKRKKLSTDEFLELLKQLPSLGFNSFQRLYAALRMFGKEKANKPWKPDRWKWMDYRIKMAREKAGMGAIYGLEAEVDQIMGYFEKACYETDMRGRFLMLLGPVSSAKTSLIDIMADTLDAFGTLPEGEIFTVKFDLKGVSEHFGDLEEVVCPAHESPLNFMEEEKLEGILEEINKDIPKWQTIHPTMTRCPSCDFIITKLTDLGEDFRKRMSVTNLKPLAEAKAYEFRPTAEKAYNPAEIFGGVTDFNRMARFGGKKEHPMVLNFGIGGTIDGPSPQRHLTHFSEMYKGGIEFLNEMLDVVQKRTLSVKGKWQVYVDSVFVGTTNLQEYGKLQELPEIGDYIRTRSIGLPIGYILVLDDMASALNKRVFDKEREKIHIPPHFVEMFLGPLSVMSTLDEATTELKTNLLEKALIYNGEMPHGKEFDFDERLRELQKEAQEKPPLVRTEGIRNGIPFRWFQNLPLEIDSALRKVPIKVRKELTDPDHPNGCMAMINIEDVVSSYIKRYDGINEETRQRLLIQIIPLCYEPKEKDSLYVSALVRDVNKSLLGEQRILNIGTQYLVQAYEDANKKREFLDARGIRQPINYEFLKEIEKSAGVVNESEFRKDLAYNVKYRRDEYKGRGGDKFLYYDWLAKKLIEESATFRRAIENYAITNVMPNIVTDVSTAYSATNEDLVVELKKMGYCRACANMAISLAAQMRRPRKR